MGGPILTVTTQILTSTLAVTSPQTWCQDAAGFIPLNVAIQRALLFL